MNALVIRYAELDDLNTIGYLAHEIWPPTYQEILSAEQLRYMLQLLYSPEALYNQLTRLKHHFLLAELDEEPVGFASFSETEPGIFHIQKLYVLPQMQGKGLGRHLIDFIIAEIAEQQATALRLNVNRYNKAKGFYERQGFAVFKEEDIPIGNDYYMNDYVMEKPLATNSTATNGSTPAL